MIKYIAYCRKSTDEPDRQILSIEAQIEEIKEFAAREGLEIFDFITESNREHELSLRSIFKPEGGEFKVQEFSDIKKIYYLSSVNRVSC